jgi:hypothetical protein
MTRLFVVFAVLALAFTPQLGFAQEKKDATAEMLAKLRKPADLATDEIRLQDLADFIADRHGVPVVINAGAFAGITDENPLDMMVKTPKVKGLALAETIRQALAIRNATILVRKGHIEIVPIATAAKEAKISGTDEDGAIRLAQPLVSAIYKEKPVNEALADLAEEYDLTIVVAPQAGDNKAGFVNARLLNVPADKAIELLALQADLRVVKKGNAFFVTGKDHANELFNERLEQQQRKIEVDRLKYAPYTPVLPMPTPPAK